MAKLCRTENAIGEERAAIIEHKRDIEYYVRRWSDRDIARKGEVFSARVLRIDKDMMAAFVDMGAGRNGLLRFAMSNNAPRLVEGAMVRVEVLRQAEANKGPLVRFIEPSGADKPAKEKSISLRETISARYPGIKFEDSLVNGIDEAAETEIALQGGGYVYIEHTRAGTMIDVDTGTGQKNAVGIAAAREIARQIRKRGIGGLILVDFPNFRKRKVQADVWQTFKDGFNGDIDGPKIAPLSRFGTVEMTRTRTGSSIAQIMMGKDGEPTTETIALQGLRRLTTEANVDGGARLVLQVPEAAFQWLEADTIGWRIALAERIGERFRIVSGATIDVYKDETKGNT
ncbi:MAG: ribonuclease E/G [Robiginitomaculum sp.]|nr:ribonuclease E/G [Robiginitomaculum sp.]